MAPVVARSTRLLTFTPHLAQSRPIASLQVSSTAIPFLPGGREQRAGVRTVEIVRWLPIGKAPHCLFSLPHRKNAHHILPSANRNAAVQ